MMRDRVAMMCAIHRQDHRCPEERNGAPERPSGMRLDTARILKAALLLGFGLHAVSLCSHAAENIPITRAETLTGRKLEFPAALQGKPAVCVFGFSKGAGDLTKVWLARLSQDGIT